MTLPNHFLADAPPGAKLTPEIVMEACRNLRRNRERHLATRSLEQVITLLCEVAAGWLKPNHHHRKLALEHGPAATGFSAATLQRGLDSFFGQFTAENFRALLAQEFGDVRGLDGLARDEERRKSAMVVAPELLVHVCAGNLPNPTLTSMTLGLLLRSAQFVKCARGAALLPRLFAHSIFELDPHVGVCLDIAEWPGGSESLEEVLFADADCVTATGSDETLAAVRARLPVSKRLVGHGHRVSFAFVTGEVLSGPGVTQIVARAADDVTAWDQQGCLSPHVIYIEDKGTVPAEKFAAMLAEELERRHAVEPRGEISVAAAATIASRREIYQLRAAHDPEATRHWCSAGSTAWTVVFESDARFQMSCLNRFIYVKPVSDLTNALQQADAVRGKVSTVGVAAAEGKATRLAEELARWGVTRVCRLGQMQNPPLAWRHDGRPPLADLVTWTDFEN